MSVAADKLHKALGIANPHEAIKYAADRGVGPGLFLHYRASQPEARIWSAWQVLRPGYRTDPGNLSTVDRQQKTFAVRGDRAEVLETAQKWAASRYDVDEWATIPGLTGVVFPKPVADLIKADLKAAASAARPGNLKVFIGTAQVPNTWKQRVNAKTDHQQADVVVVAASKKAAEALLVHAGAGDVTAAAIARELRVAMATTTTLLLVESDVLDLKRPMILVFRRPTKDQVIIRADVPGLPVVGHFRFRDVTDFADRGDSYGLYVEAQQ